MKQEATILSAELSGLQTLTEKISSEEITELMNEIHSMFIATITMHHGDVNNFAGESIISVFQEIKSGTAKHAVDSSYELNDQFQTFIKDKKLDQKLLLKIGIATGNIVSTDIGKGDKKQSTIMGSAVNHASRICQFAEVGQILVDFSTHENTQEYYTFHSLEPIPLKGGVETLPIFELTGKKRKKLDLKTKSERKIISEMVGRSREAEQLEGLIRNLIAGKGSIVNIVGKAGIGKSRLVEELKVQPLLEKVLLLEGRAISTGQNLSFHPITNLIKNWAGITEDDLPSLSSKKLYEGIKKNTPEQADEIFAFLSTMMGLPLEGKQKERVKGIEGEALEKLILKNLRDLIIAATKDKPRIYLVEDAHWSDSSSITLFESLYKLTQNYPVMFINVMRPGYKETGDYILKYLVDQFPGDHTTININPLEEKESGLLIKNLLRRTSLPNEIHNLIIRKTEGNPFFIEEIIRSFIDEGIIEVKEGQFVVTDKIKEVNIPETINDAILSRVDKLDEKTRELLRTASVIGRNFYYKVLEEVTDTIGELDDRLQYLKEVQLINESEKKEEIEYLFKHALAQQVTYESIINENKKELHLKIARSIENVFAENLHEFYATLAHHYERAEKHDKMELYLIMAGDESMKTGASNEAIHFYNNALAALKYSQGAENKQKIIELNEKLGYAHYALGKNIKASEYFQKVVPDYRFTNIPTNKVAFNFKVLYSLTRFYFMLFFSRNSKAYQPSELDEKEMKLLLFLGEAMVSFDPRQGILYTAILGTSVPLQKLVRTNHGIAYLFNLNITFYWSGRALWFGDKVDKFLRPFLDIKNPYVYYTHLYYETIASYLAGKLLTDSRADEDVFKYGMERGRIWAPTVHHAFKGIGYVEQGRKKDALKLIEYLNTISKELEHSFSLTQYHRLQITYYLKYRKIDKLISEAVEVIETIGKTDHSSILLLGHCIISMAYSLKNDINKAREHYQKATVLSKKLWLKYYASMTDLAKVYLQLAELKLQKDVNNYDELLATTKKLVSNSNKVNCNKTEAFRLRAVAFAYANKKSQALKYFKKSIDFANWYGAKLELSRTYFELGKFLSDSNVKYKELNGHPASHYLDKAKAMFEKMDLQWDLEEYQMYIEKENLNV